MAWEWFWYAPNWDIKYVNGLHFSKRREGVVVLLHQQFGKFNRIASAPPQESNKLTVKVKVLSPLFICVNICTDPKNCAIEHEMIESDHGAWSDILSLSLWQWKEGISKMCCDKKLFCNVP